MSVFIEEEGRLGNFLYQVEVMMMHWFSWMLLLAKCEVPYKATHKFLEGLKYENDEVILQLPRGIQGATKASSTKTQTFDTQENNTNWALQNHPKRNPNYVIAEAKTKTPPKLINDPTQFDINARIQWRKNIRDHAKNWVQSQTSTPLPLLTTHSLRLTKIVFVSTLVCKVDFCSMKEFVRCDVNHILPFVMIPCVFCLEKSWYKIWCKLYGCLD